MAPIAIAMPPKDITFGETAFQYEAMIWARRLPLTDGDLNVTTLPDGRLKLTFRNEGDPEFDPNQSNPFALGRYNISLSWADGMTPVEWSKEFLLRHTYMSLEIPITQPVAEAYIIFNVPKKLRGDFTACYKGDKKRILKGKNRKCPKGFES